MRLQTRFETCVASRRVGAVIGLVGWAEIRGRNQGLESATPIGVMIRAGIGACGWGRSGQLAGWLVSWRFCRFLAILGDFEPETGLTCPIERPVGAA
ncbi:hypothetical protein EB810_05890 [Altererythrobacter sp. FM1]|nr:hypothetical protein EB810_05890 [Altererythrobacter sp. FM1]